MDFLHRTWAQINLDNLRHNFKLIKDKVGDCMVMCVVKANAYGHGAVAVATELEKCGCDWFGVSNIEEAEQLRQTGIKAPILILGATPASCAKRLHDGNITQALYSAEYAQALSEAAVRAGVEVKAHLKLDTGMRRIGFNCADEAEILAAQKACGLSGVAVSGVFTHFASADLDGDEDEQGSFTDRQFSLFEDAIEKLEAAGIKFDIKHCCNSAATVGRTEYKMDMVREGIVLYGLSPSDEIGADGFKPVMSLHSAVSMVKTVSAGEAISYGRTFTADKEIEVATVPVGYADGYIRAFGKAQVLVNGKRAKVLGRVCMDQLMIDVTGLDVKRDALVTLFGDDGDESISVNELSKLAGTINYETVCSISHRVVRVYIKDGKQAFSTCLLNQ